MSKWLTRRMVKRGIIEAEDEELYQFGIRNAIIMILNMITALLIGLLTARVWVVCVFTISFMMLRSYSGGYHCNNRVFCYIGSNAVLFVPIYMQTVFLRMPMIVTLLVLAASVTVIMILSPMDSRNRQLDPTEQKYFGARARTVALVQVGIFFLLWHMKYYHYANAIYISICTTAVFMLAGKMQLWMLRHIE